MFIIMYEFISDWLAGELDRIGGGAADFAGVGASVFVLKVKLKSDESDGSELFDF